MHEDEDEGRSLLRAAAVVSEDGRRVMILSPSTTAAGIRLERDLRVTDALAGTPLLFTGDTLFPGGPGATQFEGGDFPTIIDSIDTKLFTFPDHTIVMPGHGVDTTIGRERPHLQEWVDRGW